MKPAGEATTVLEALTLALEYIESGWCQNGLAQDATAHLCDSRAPVARAVCAYGAINRATSHPGVNLEAKMALKEDRASTSNVVAWNDTADRSHRDVIQLFERAVERERARARAVKELGR